jgi:hypothetical protein
MGPHPQVESDDGYPRTYRAVVQYRRFCRGFGIFLLGLAIVVTPLHVAHVIKPSLRPLDLTFFDMFFAVIAATCFLSANRYVTLYEDAIEVKGLFSTRMLRRAAIAGHRMGRLPIMSGGSSYYIMVPSGGEKELKLPPYLHVDKTFFAWMRKSPLISENSANSAD